MIGYNLITHQTTKQGLKVNAVLVHEGVDIVRQIYFAFILDRNSQGPAIVASTEGGVEIEEVAKKTLLLSKFILLILKRESLQNYSSN